MVILFHYPSNYVTAYSKTKIHNAYFFCLFLRFFSFQHFLIRPEKNKNPKQNTHKKPKVTFYSFWIACLSLAPPKKPIYIAAFHRDSKCCDLYQLSVVLKNRNNTPAGHSHKTFGFQSTLHS